MCIHTNKQASNRVKFNKSLSILQNISNQAKSKSRKGSAILENYTAIAEIFTSMLIWVGGVTFSIYTGRKNDCPALAERWQ
jgi:hypothetical protein